MATNSMHMKLKFQSKLELRPRNRVTCRVQIPQIQYGRLKAILKVTSLKINRLFPIHTSDAAMKFGLDIQSQTEFRVRKPKNPRWPLGGHFESDITENQ